MNCTRTRICSPVDSIDASSAGMLDCRERISEVRRSVKLGNLDLIIVGWGF